MDQSANLRTSSMYLSGNQPKGKENRRARSVEREREGRRVRHREKKARIRAVPLIFFLAGNDTVHSTPSFEWYCLSFLLSLLLCISQLRRWLTFGSADNWLIKLEPCAYRLHCRSKIRLEEKKGFKSIELAPCLQLTISPNSQPSIHDDAPSSFR